jgi:hypothetical protein
MKQTKNKYKKRKVDNKKIVILSKKIRIMIVVFKQKITIIKIIKVKRDLGVKAKTNW